jgi:hypothetical protein
MTHPTAPRKANVKAANEARMKNTAAHAQSLKWILVALHIEQELAPTAIAKFMITHRFAPSCNGFPASGKVCAKQVRRLLKRLDIHRVPKSRKPKIN